MGGGQQKFGKGGGRNCYTGYMVLYRIKLCVSMTKGFWPKWGFSSYWNSEQASPPYTNMVSLEPQSILRGDSDINILLLENPGNMGFRRNACSSVKITPHTMIQRCSVLGCTRSMPNCLEKDFAPLLYKDVFGRQRWCPRKISASV